MDGRLGRNKRAYRRAAARLKRTASVCWVCGEAIDPTLYHLDGMAATADHVDPLALGGHILGELRAAHRSCNASRGTGQPRTKARRSRDW
jgi:hypothetical protein